MDDLSTTTRDLGDIADILQKRVLDSPDVTAFIDQLAHHAADTLSSAAADVFCSVTLLQGRNRTRSAASGETAKHMDETQYAFGDGPCLTSARDGTVVHVADTATEPNWRAYLDTIDDTGIRSILAVPFELAGDADGALNLYATEPGVFTEETLSLAQRYADEASMSLRLAVRMGQLAETQENLHAAMRSRTVIDVAVGILMAQNSCGQQEAFRLLKTASANRNVKLHDVATRVVASVSPEPVQTHFTGDGG